MLPLLAGVDLRVMAMKVNSTVLIFLEQESHHQSSLVDCGCGIHRMYLCRRVRYTPNNSPRYGTKDPDGDVPVMQEVWEIRCTLSLPSLPGQLWPKAVAPDPYLSTPPLGQDMTQGQFLSGV